MILGHLEINDNITISPGTMITKSLNKSNNKYTAIMPFMEHKEWLKLATKLREKKNKMATNKLSMDIHEILDHLPHRYPFILVDRVISMELGKE